MAHLIAFIVIVFATMGMFNLFEKLYNFYKDYTIKKEVDEWVNSLTDEQLDKIIKKHKQNKGE